MGRIHGGMTVNERLGELGLFDEWDRAVADRDRRRMIRMMLKVELSDEQAASTVDTILANPAMYGF